MKEEDFKKGLHPIEVFFSSHHPMSSFLEVSFKGSKGGKVEIDTKAPLALVRDNKDRLHSGFATIVLDSIMGGAVMGVMEKLQPIATISLSVQHLRRAIAGEMVHGEADCTGIYNDLAYVSGRLISADKNDVLAIASGTFMIGTRAKSIRE